MKCILLIFLPALFFNASFLQAQDITNTKWKTFAGEPINDSVCVNFKTDTAYLSSGKGGIITSAVKFVKDTVTFMDVSGEHACLMQEGKYTYSFRGKFLTFRLVSDECFGRQLLAGFVFLPVPAEEFKK
jgi:hypothetical protein